MGCFGHLEDGFTLCGGCENKILTVGTQIQHYNEMMDYFDACRLFDRPMFEFNSIRHFIHNMQDKYDQVAVGKRLWTERQFILYQKFVLDHRTCGLYIKLELTADKSEPKIEEKSFLIKGSNNKLEEPRTLNLKLIRGRR